MNMLQKGAGPFEISDSPNGYGNENDERRGTIADCSFIQTCKGYIYIVSVCIRSGSIPNWIGLVRARYA
jgi:hypothetical protein